VRGNAGGQYSRSASAPAAAHPEEGGVSRRSRPIPRLNGVSHENDGLSNANNGVSHEESLAESPSPSVPDPAFEDEDYFQAFKESTEGDQAGAAAEAATDVSLSLAQVVDVSPFQSFPLAFSYAICVFQ